MQRIGHERGVVEREAGEPLPGVAGAVCGDRRVRHGVQHVVDDRPEQVGLAGEIGVERRGRDVGDAGDSLHAGAGVAVLDEQPASGREDRAPLTIRTFFLAGHCRSRTHA